MKRIWNKLLFNRYLYVSYQDGKRYAGHSKWANIKHIKEEKDNEKMVLFHHLKLQMKIAIQEGGSNKPTINLRLAQIIERAKKANMPVASINSFLEKIETRKDKIINGIIEIRGPSGYVMLVRYTTDNTKKFRMDLNNRLKKCSARVADSSIRNMFEHTGSIIVERKCDLEQATEDAIIVGAEDVKEFKENDNKYLQFTCDPKFLSKIKNLLEGRQYCVLSMEEDYVPHKLIELNQSDLKAISQIRDKILQLEDVSHIHDNVAYNL